MEKIKTAMQHIRKKCLDCCCNKFTEVDMCTAVACPLYPFRHGKHPSTMLRKEPEKEVSGGYWKVEKREARKKDE